MTVTITRDLRYATVDGQPLLADLYRPQGAGTPPVCLYMHGGGFQFGSRGDDSEQRLAAMAGHGIAVLSIDYRLTPAKFPDQLHDVKAAVRWLRANAAEHGVAGERIGAWGASAGAILAALAGLTGDRDDLEGAVGDHADRSSRVDAVVTWFGVFDMLSSALRSGLEARLMSHEFSATYLGVGGHADVAGLGEAARAASPLDLVTGSAPPFLIAHGDRDRMAPMAESQALHDRLVRAGAPSSLLLVGGAGHEGAAFEAPANLALTAAFLKVHLGAA